MGGTSFVAFMAPMRRASFAAGQSRRMFETVSSNVQHRAARDDDERHRFVDQRDCVKRQDRLFDYGTPRVKIVVRTRRG
jgi:hypothetical protein